MSSSSTPGVRDPIRGFASIRATAAAGQLAWGGVRYAGWVIVEQFKALFQHLRLPIAPVSTPRRIGYATFMVLIAPLVFLALATTTPIRLMLRRARQN